MNVTDIPHATFCLPRPGETEVRTESYTVTGDTGVTVVHRCIECGEQRLTRLGPL